MNESFLENHFSFVDDQDEWVGTDVVFDIERGDHDTTVTHVGLVPELECYDVCSVRGHTTSMPGFRRCWSPATRRR